MTLSAREALRRLETIATTYEEGATSAKCRLIDHLGNASLATAEEIVRLHECLCFLWANPEDPETLRAARRVLRAFGERSDVERFRYALEDSGIAGTAINYRFYWRTACWLARHWPDQISIDWADWDNRDHLLAALPSMLTYSDTLALDEAALETREWVDTLRGTSSDAAFLATASQRLPGDEFTRERVYDLLDVPLRVEPAAGTPARGRDAFPVAEVAYRTEPLRRDRPDLRTDVLRAPVSIEALSPADGRRLIDLARRAMVTRSRDLDGFANADPNDARWVDCGDGLAFGLLGLRPPRRLMLESSYAALTLRNGVPIGYVLVSALYDSAAIAYNIFETFRGAEAAHVFGRVLAMGRAIFGCDTFSIDPYQLGYGNAEGLASGAWWFYYKLGFRPRSPQVKRLVREQLRLMKRDRSHRTPLDTLEELASENMYFQLGTPRDDVIGEIPLGAIGLGVSRWLSAQGPDRRRALKDAAASTADSLGVRREDLSPAERLWWNRWSPVVGAIGALEWSRPQRRQLARVVLAKGSRYESDFVPLFDAHARLRESLLTLAADNPG